MRHTAAQACILPPALPCQARSRPLPHCVGSPYVQAPLPFPLPAPAAPLYTVLFRTAPFPQHPPACWASSVPRHARRHGSLGAAAAPPRPRLRRSRVRPRAGRGWRRCGGRGWGRRGGGGARAQGSPARSGGGAAAPGACRQVSARWQGLQGRVGCARLRLGSFLFPRLAWGPMGFRGHVDGPLPPPPDQKRALRPSGVPARRACAWRCRRRPGAASG